jgi:hypothetical protein
MRSAARTLLGVAAVLAWSPAVAHSYRIELAQPAGGRLLKGHAGVEAADERTAAAVVRIVAPGNEIKDRGTVRVLVMNLGPKPFELGPDQVTLTLGDGTVLRPTPVAAFEDGRELVEREMRHAGTVDLQNRNNLQGLSEQMNSGPTAQPMAPAGGASAAEVTGSQESRSDESMLPGAGTLDAIYQLLITQTVEPQKAWGGYYVFDVPKAVLARRTDQPLTIIVTTGPEQHRFEATLKWK